MFHHNKKLNNLTSVKNKKFYLTQDEDAQLKSNYFLAF